MYKKLTIYFVKKKVINTVETFNSIKKLTQPIQIADKMHFKNEVVRDEQNHLKCACFLNDEKDSAFLRLEGRELNNLVPIN